MPSQRVQRFYKSIGSLAEKSETQLPAGRQLLGFAGFFRKWMILNHPLNPTYD
jgi:hypothetical protein